MLDDSLIPDNMPEVDEYNEAAKVAVMEALGSGNLKLTKALQTMIDFTGALTQIIGKALDPDGG